MRWTQSQVKWSVLHSILNSHTETHDFLSTLSPFTMVSAKHFIILSASSVVLLSWAHSNISGQLWNEAFLWAFFSKNKYLHASKMCSQFSVSGMYCLVMVTFYCSLHLRLWWTYRCIIHRLQVKCLTVKRLLEALMIKSKIMSWYYTRWMGLSQNVSHTDGAARETTRKSTIRRSQGSQIALLLYYNKRLTIMFCLGLRHQVHSARYKNIHRIG